MANRKVFCEVIEGIAYEDRCLYKLSKIVEGSRVCESCILRELKKIQSCKSKGAKKVRLKKGNETKQKKRGRPRKEPCVDTVPTADEPHIDTVDTMGNFSNEEESRLLSQDDEDSP